MAVAADVKQCDVVVVGAGIAGASVAAELAESRNVILLERESQPGYHTTGRSAAVFTRAYGPPVIRALTRASESFLRGKDGLAGPAESQLRPRGVLFPARSDQMDKLDRMAEELGDTVEALSGSQVREMMPILRDGYAAAGLYDATAADIEVHGVHQYYLKKFKSLGGELQTGDELLGLTASGSGWEVETRSGVIRAAVVVNAAGAWADEVAELAGVGSLGLVPKRRTALLVSPPENCVPDPWPMTVDVEEKFYLKPDAGKLLISPADATPSPPCDAQPDEMDVAICVDRIETAFDLSVRRIEHKWAGLRSFLPDGCPAAGYDPRAAGFFWLAGQGGYGIQSAPALARAAAALVLEMPIPSDIADEGVEASVLAPRLGKVAA
ncbi:FAD-dependent oxidoreductase [uncultured Roseibium sp.]|uniref:NAD(P)/FAD-dependent oxidoreductase n=1 Tax=uncultured Roseibium sp. TaxID=1936171 RepID=UPI00321711A9